jgi:hypothetical protein
MYVCHLFHRKAVMQINKVYSVSEVASIMSSGPAALTDPSTEVRGIVYAYITSLDIDGPSTGFLARRW